MQAAMTPVPGENTSDIIIQLHFHILAKEVLLMVSYLRIIYLFCEDFDICTYYKQYIRINFTDLNERDVT